MSRILFCLLLISGFVSAQIKLGRANPSKSAEDTVVIKSTKADSLKIFHPTIEDYQFKTENGQYQIFDTIFTAEKIFKFTQFNNQDNFGRVRFDNVGRGFNPLVYAVDPNQELALLPTGKSFGILSPADIKYYDVKTPTTTFEYHSAVGNGNVLNSTYTQNVGKRFNIAVNYLGLRSLGLYQNSLAVNNHFNIAAHYQNKSGRYELYAHYLNQNVNNDENGGITVLDQFLGNDSRFNNRQNVQVNLQNTETLFTYRRYYLNHDFGLFKINGSYPIRLRHLLEYEYEKYYFVSPNESFFATATNPFNSQYPASAKKFSYKLTNVFSLAFDREKFKADAGLKYENIRLGANEILQNNQLSPVTWHDNRIGLVGNLEIKLWNKLALNSHGEYTTGSRFGSLIKLNNQIGFATTDKAIDVVGHLNFVSAAPSFNYLMNGSMYQNYNFVFTGFKNQTILNAGGVIKLKWLDAQAIVNLYNISNYTYFDSDLQPHQASSSLNISQFGGQLGYSFDKFHLTGRILVQSAINNKNLLPMPHLIGRAAFYYQSKMFKNAAEMQFGLKANYFSKFASRDFSPVLNEFVLPGSNSFSIGGKPTMDAFINLKVRTMMIYFEGQHFNTVIGKNKLFAAPFYPTVDFRVNLGIVWYIFS